MDHAYQIGDRLQAFHRNAPVLTPAAYEDFGRAVDTLLRLGRFDEAVLSWADCVEIQHFPPAINGRAGRGGLPACRVAPCGEMAFQRCRDIHKGRSHCTGVDRRRCLGSRSWEPTVSTWG